MVTSVLLLLAIALVLIGVITLVIGIVSNTLAWVFISIGATVLAGIVLYVLYRIGRKEAAVGTGSVPQSAPATPPAATTPVVPAPTAVPPAPIAAPITEEFAPATSVDAARDGTDDEYDDYDDDMFPIAEYDDLRVAEILPLLPELDADELEVVRNHEVATKARATILARIDELAPHAPPGYGQTQAIPDADAASDIDDEEFDDDEFADDELEEEQTQAPRPAPASRRGALPIAAYDDLKVAENLPLLSRLDAGQLAAVARHEEQGPNRQTVLNRINARISTLERRGSATSSQPPRTPTGRPAASRRAAAPRTQRAAVAAPAPKPAAEPVRRATSPRVGAVMPSAPVRTARTATPSKVGVRGAATPAKRQPSGRGSPAATPAPPRVGPRKTAKVTTPPATPPTRRKPLTP
ncbi:MAG: hypothetical protein NVS3B12_28530 [Acidimicrobiales bacterium]